MKRLYSIAMTAQGAGNIFTGITHLEADSEAEAIRIGMQMVRLKAPSNEGWDSHNVIVSEVPQELIDKYAVCSKPHGNHRNLRLR